jgi:hypothetical protein
MNIGFRLAFLLTLICVCLSFAQQPDPLPRSLTAPDNGQEAQDSGQSLADMARKIRKDHSEETKMTAEDAKRLFAAVDRIANFASEDSGFPMHSPVKRRMIGPDDLEKSARSNLSKPEYADRFARSELTMKKFGLLPRDFDLKEFLIKAQRKNIGAYYDDETKTISLMKTIPVEQQEAILAHELTHALQDQNFNLQVWMTAGEPSSGKGSSVDGGGESSAARRAVVEGQASVVFVDYLLSRTGRTVENTPGIIYNIEDPMVKGTVDSQLMHAAPMILREWGEFPYHQGLIFEGELLQAGGKKLAFQDVFAHPPRSTHEILQPRVYLDHEKAAAVAIPNAKAILGDAYELYDSGSVGELDVSALLWQLGTRTLADDLSKNWRGGSYLAFHKKAPAAPTTADLKLFYVSRWSSPEAAQRFAKFYAYAASRRYQTATTDGAAPCLTNACPFTSALITTEEGPVIVELSKENTVLVSESFDQETAAKLITAARDVTPKSAMMHVSQQELGMRFDDLPAFRTFQKRLGQEILSDSISQRPLN